MHCCPVGLIDKEECLLSKDWGLSPGSSIF